MRKREVKRYASHWPIKRHWDKTDLTLTCSHRSLLDELNLGTKLAPKCWLSITRIISKSASSGNAPNSLFNAFVTLQSSPKRDVKGPKSLSWIATVAAAIVSCLIPGCRRLELHPIIVDLCLCCCCGENTNEDEEHGDCLLLIWSRFPLFEVLKVQEKNNKKKNFY